MMQYLQSHYPHFPRMLLHHWCADTQGALALLETWQNMWRQSWKQDQTDGSPWVVAVNILLLKLMRDSITRLPSEHGAHSDHVMGCIVGGLFDWALKNFLKQHVEGAVELTRIATYEGMVIPVTPMTFLCRQPEDSLLGDDRYVVMAYGLDPDLVPRMRELRKKVGPEHETGMTALLANDRMGEHFLRRSWARLALWEMAEQTGQGVWMQWVLDAKKLDLLLARPERLPETVFKQLRENCKYSVASWLLSCYENKGKDVKPWVKDDRVLAAFRVFEEDVNIERARRKAEKSWFDYQSHMQKKVQGAEADRAFEKAWSEGSLVYFRRDPEISLHSGASLSAKQACLRVEWADLLAWMQAHQSDFSAFMMKTFLPKVIGRSRGVEHLFMDHCSATGCLLRGSSTALVRFALDIQGMASRWVEELGKKDEEEAFDAGKVPSMSMCMTLIGDWSVVRYKDSEMGLMQMGVGSAVVQAEAGVMHDEGTSQLVDWYDKKAGVLPLGKVRIGKLSVSKNEKFSVLCNHGFAMTAAAVGDYINYMKNRARVREFELNHQLAGSIMTTFRVPGKSFHMIAIMPNQEEDVVHMLVQVGRANLAGVDVDLYEFLDKQSDAYQMLLKDVLAGWALH